MKEPRINYQGRGEFLAYSAAPIGALRDRVNNNVTKSAETDEWYDDDFRRRYAAILLRERGC